MDHHGGVSTQVAEDAVGFVLVTPIEEDLGLGVNLHQALPGVDKRLDLGSELGMVSHLGVHPSFGQGLSCHWLKQPQELCQAAACHLACSRGKKQSSKAISHRDSNDRQFCWFEKQVQGLCTKMSNCSSILWSW